jgi:hypothetical protein
MGSADHGKLGLVDKEESDLDESRGSNTGILSVLYSRKGDRLKTKIAYENSGMGIVNVDGKKIKQVACGF